MRSRPRTEPTRSTDVKPANVLLDDDGNAYLSDFGIAEDLTDWRDSVPPEGLGYSAPEILRGEDVTPSADIFALGMIAQDLVNGRGNDPRVAGVIGRATADDPKDRYGDPEELARALRDALGATTTATADRPTRARTATRTRTRSSRPTRTTSSAGTR